MDFNGKNVWITGGASGIGLAIGKRFAAAGACVTVFDLRLRDEAMLELNSARRFAAIPVRSYVLDVADAEQVRRLFNLAADGLGGAAFPLEQAQLVPQADDLSLLAGVHGGLLGDATMNKTRTKFKRSR